METLTIFDVFWNTLVAHTVKAHHQPFEQVFGFYFHVVLIPIGCVLLFGGLFPESMWNLTKTNPRATKKSLKQGKILRIVMWIIPISLLIATYYGLFYSVHMKGHEKLVWVVR